MQNFWRDRRVFVTGATGFLGGWLVQRLLELGADVVCLVRDENPRSMFVRDGLKDRVSVVYGDLSEYSTLERVLGEHEIQTVMHLAAQAIVGVANRNPLSTFEANIQGTWNLLEACRRSPLVKQIIIASSDKAYGAHETLPYTENMPLQGVHPYDVSKSCADLICASYAQTYNLPVVVTRCGNLFGGGDLNWSRIIPGTIRSVLNNERPLIRSDGQFVRDYFYVEDAAACYTLLAEKLEEKPELRGRAYNFSLEEPLSVLDVVNRVLTTMNSNREPDVRNEASHEIREQFLSAKLAHAELGWQAQIGFNEGLRRTIDWYRNFHQR
jgi:CDP-glucose 4,6-dehydratase